MRFSRIIAVACASLIAVSTPANSQSRLKDLVDVEGVRSNQLVGYGLVVGLNGTGDKSQNSPFTDQSLRGMLERLGVSVRGNGLKTRNVAAVTVTATLPPFARQGSTLDVTVSSLGDATSLSGGVLLVTPLLAADGEVYAVAQGSLVAGGDQASGAAETVTKNIPTVARVANGAIIEKEIEFALSDMTDVKLILKNPDFTTAKRIEQAVNSRLRKKAAQIIDNTTVAVNRGSTSAADLIAMIENVQVKPDAKAKVVVDDRTGTIIIGENVRIGRIAISQGGLTVKVSENAAVVQPEPLSDGETVVVPQTDVEMKEVQGGFSIVNGPVMLKDLVDGLNQLGVKPRDMIAILQAIKASGAMSADLEIL
ncbi:flagellar basal body P-ring protein FlgI [Mesorhizobium sp. SP-1A]|uniref:flagellar basal body P-ring protein FlgI n=1 Tax=Mesorhizobium sp. SP-1A TaxID=3077840 RepID=UPI0028F73DBF|nr:flagellar basal body P-ring protein FlgI [Mesorhizobium sp. SP-1A]